MRSVGFLVLWMFAFVAVTAVSGQAEAATPVSSEIVLESSASLCIGV